MRINLPLLISTAIASVLAFIAGEYLYRQAGELPNVLIIGIFIAIFSLLLCLAVFLCEYAFETFAANNFRSKVSKPKTRANILKLIAVLMVGIFGMGTLFQFLYELEPQKKPVTEVNNYAFIVDNSGSMSSNDPAATRFTALEEIADTLAPDKSVAIYLFSTDTICARSFEPQTTGPVICSDSWFSESGGTRLYTALRECMSDIENGLTSGSLTGRTRIIVLTDGKCEQLSAGNLRCRNTIRRASLTDCEIFTIGFGSPDAAMLTMIAEGTGGSYFDAGTSYNISSALNSAVNAAATTGRLLNGIRTGHTAYNFGYALMRIVFVTLLGFTISALSSLILSYEPIEKFVFIQCAIKSIAAAVFLEVFLQNFAGDTLHRFIACLLIGTLLLFVNNSDNARPGISFSIKTGHFASQAQPNKHPNASIGTGSPQVHGSDDKSIGINRRY